MRNTGRRGGNVEKRNRADETDGASNNNNTNNSNNNANSSRKRQQQEEHDGADDVAPQNNNNHHQKEMQAARRHNVDTTVDKVLDEEDEEWEDDTSEDNDDLDNIPEEIIDDYEATSEDEEDDDDDENQDQGQEGNTNNNNNNNSGTEGAISKTNEKSEKKVRFVGGLNNDDDNEPIARVYRPDKDQAKDPNVQLTFSNRAYESFFQLRTEFPCLSFSILRDFDGDARTKYPMSMYLACGTQAPKKSDNQIVLLQVSNLVKTRNDEASDSDDEEEIGMIDDDEDENDEDEDPDGVNNGEAVVNARTIAVPAAVNRLRCKEDAPNMIAFWCEDGTVRVVDAMDEARALADFDNWTAERAKNWDKPVANPHVFCSSRADHRNEGYGLGWCRSGNLNRFASGDCSGHIVVWNSKEGAGWAAESSSHREAPSVEEIVWSPVEATVFIAARAGGSVEVWDTRDMRSSRVQFRADPTDINVADWNRAQSNSHLLATGADSGIISVWDLRKIQSQNPAPLQRLTFHEGRSVTSLEFSVHNETVLSATSADGQCTLWDLCVERDVDEEREMVGGLFGRPDISELPDALMFQHQGLFHPKECHFHPQIPGAVVTADYNGVHIFKPCNWRSLMK